MELLKKIFGLQTLSLLVIAAWVVPALLTVYVEPDEIGVRRSMVSGIENEDFGQGRHFDLGFLHSWYRLPRPPIPGVHRHELA